MNEDEYTFLTFCEQFFALSTRLPTVDEAASRGHDKKLVKKCIVMPLFNKMLSQRGIRPYDFVAVSGDKSQLDPEELLVANTMLSLKDNRSQKNKLRDLGISAAKYEMMQRNPHFQAYLLAKSEGMLGDAIPDAHMSLVHNVQGGDLGAIKFLYEITGRYVPERGAKSIDIQSILIRVLESVQRHVSDLDEQAAIGHDLVAIAKESSAQYNGQSLIRDELVITPDSSVTRLVKDEQVGSSLMNPRQLPVGSVSASDELGL